MKFVYCSFSSFMILNNIAIPAFCTLATPSTDHCDQFSRCIVFNPDLNVILKF